MGMTAPGSKAQITGRCYCGATTFEASGRPLTVAYCHCDDCRRACGAPVAAFAAFESSAVTFNPDEGKVASAQPGAYRSFCKSCGSPLASRYDYLPGQIYVSVGIIDQANELEPQLHAHHGRRLSWFDTNDNLDRFEQSSRDCLQHLAAAETSNNTTGGPQKSRPNS